MFAPRSLTVSVELEKAHGGVPLADETYALCQLVEESGEMFAVYCDCRIISVQAAERRQRAAELDRDNCVAMALRCFFEKLTKHLRRAERCGMLGKFLEIGKLLFTYKFLI